LARYKAQLDGQADERKAKQDASSADHEADIKRMLQAHDSEMRKQQLRFEDELRKFAFENQTIFAALHKERMPVVSQFQKLIVEVRDKFTLARAGVGAQDFTQRFENTIKALKDLGLCCAEVIHLIPEPLERAFDEFNDAVRMQLFEADALSGLERKELALARREAFVESDKRIAQAFKALTEKLRVMVGTIDNDDAKGDKESV
jgi:hypothetical protein